MTAFLTPDRDDEPCALTPTITQADIDAAVRVLCSLPGRPPVATYEIWKRSIAAEFTAHRSGGQREAFAEALQIADEAANRGRGFVVGSGHETAVNIRDAIRSAMEKNDA